MDEDKLRNQVPIFRFLNKHKWRIVLPILIIGGYLGLPLYWGNKDRAVQFHLFILPGQNATAEQVGREVTNIAEQIQSDESMLELMKKYDLLVKDRRKGMPTNELLDKMRAVLAVEPQTQSPELGVTVHIWAFFWEDEPQKSIAVSDEIASRFESRPNLDVQKIPDITPSIGPGPAVSMIILGLPGVFCSLILIFIWEMPFLFYSKKTQEMVFDPIRSDWRDERIEAKMNGDIMEVVVVNIRYSFAFIGAILAKSPIGELFEFVGKVAR